MPATMTEEHTYLLGHSSPELERLQRQAQFYEPLTAQALYLAGIQPGMRVLDIGCGAGDVSLLLARMIGPTGEIIAVDTSAEALAVAERRLASAGIENVHLIEDDIATIQLDAPVDAVVGRLILMHVQDPVGVLRNLSRALGPSGLLLMQEMDIGEGKSEPPVPLVEELLELCRQAFVRGGVDARPGLRLHDQFVAAGLPAPMLTSLGRIEAAPAPLCAAMLTGVLSTLLPVIEATGLGTAADLQLDTLPARLSEHLERAGGLAFAPPLITAWTRMR